MVTQRTAAMVDHTHKITQQQNIGRDQYNAGRDINIGWDATPFDHDQSRSRYLSYVRTRNQYIDPRPIPSLTPILLKMDEAYFNLRAVPYSSSEAESEPVNPPVALSSL